MTDVSTSLREQLDLVSVERELLVNSVSDARELTKDEVLLEYSNVFTGFGGTLETIRLSFEKERCPSRTRLELRVRTRLESP